MSAPRLVLDADAEMIVSGDSHLLDLGQWRGIRILFPALALREIEDRQD